MEDKPDMKKLVLGLVIGCAVIGGVIYAGYSYSQKQGGLVLPRGTYTGQTEGFKSDTPPTAPLRFTVATDTAWVTFQGKKYPYSFSFPQTLSLSIFPNDPADSVAINWGNINPSFNILLNVDLIKDRDPSLVGKTEEYVNNWWKAFSGLKGVLSVDKLNNANGLIGYKAIFVNNAGQTPNVDVFMELPVTEKGVIVHLANGVLDPLVFNRIVDSLKYSPIPTGTPGP